MWKKLTSTYLLALTELFASMDVPEKDRELFYTHMGHSKDINKNVYQSPLSIMGLTMLGPKLMEIIYIFYIFSILLMQVYLTL